MSPVSKNKQMLTGFLPTSNNNDSLVNSVTMLILPLDSVDKHTCNITTHTHTPCKDEIVLQNPDCETTSPPSAIHNYDKDNITFYLANINSASYAAQNYLFNKCLEHHV